MAKLNVDSVDLLKQMRDAIEKQYGETLAGSWDPLVEMAVYAASPGLSQIQKFAANREIAQYIYPKRKAVEHSGETGGLNIMLVQFTPDGKGAILAGQLAQEPTNALPRNVDSAEKAVVGETLPTADEPQVAALRRNS